MAVPVPPGDLGLSIVGLGTQYPPFSTPPSALETLAKRFYPDSPAYDFLLPTSWGFLPTQIRERV